MSGRRKRQAGFTLMEIMVAVTVSATVLTPALALLFATLEWRDEAAATIRLNQQARLTFDVLANGARAGSNGTNGTPYIYGIRGRKVAPSGALRSNYSLQYVSNGLTVTGDTFAATTVTCTAAEQPLPDCTAAGQVKTVTGYLGRDVTLDAVNRSVSGRTVEAAITVTDPFEARRLENPRLASETYRGVFTLNRDETDP